MRAEKCRLCPAVASRGAYYWPDRARPGKFFFALLCDAHGREAVSKGAKKMPWRPKPKREE